MSVLAAPETKPGTTGRPDRRVIYCADVSGASGAQRHREAVVRLLGDSGWTVEAVEGVARPLRRIRRSSTASGSGPVHRYAGALLLLANSIGRLVSLIASILRDGEPDAILWRPGLFQFHGLAVAVLFRIPLVLEVNAPLAAEAERFRNYPLLGLAARLERRITARADRIVTVSRENARRLGRPEETTVVPNGGGYLDPSEAQIAGAWRAECPICRDPRGTRYAVLLESFRDWHGDAERRTATASIPDGWTVLALGDGPNRETFLRWAAAEGAPVVSLGHLDPPAVQHVLAAHADLGFVLYPKLDGFWFSPLKLYDFLAHGVPVVATDIGQVGEVGRAHPLVSLVPPEDLEAVARTVRAVASDLSGGPRPRRCIEDVLTSPHGWPVAVIGYGTALELAVATTR